MISLISYKDHIGFPGFHTRIIKDVLVCEQSRSYWKPKIKLSEEYSIT